MDLVEIIGLAIWWTEGTKIRLDKRWKSTYIYAVEVTNTNPEIIKIFLRYVREKLDVQNDKVKLQLQIHQGDNIEEIENFWALGTGITRSQFNKTIIRPQGNRVGKTRGTCKIRIYDKHLFLKISERLDNLRGVVHR